MHKLCSRDSAHDLCVSLVHAFVAIVAVLTDSRQSQAMLIVCYDINYSLRLAP